MTLSRRAALQRGLMLACAPIALAGCATLTGRTAATIAAQVVSDAQTIATGLSGVLPALTALRTIPAATASSVSTLLSEAIGVAKSISSGMTASAAQPLVKQIEGDVNAAVQALAVLPLPPSIESVLLAAQVLLPVVESAVGLAVPAGAVKGGMTPAQARAVLKAA